MLPFYRLLGQVVVVVDLADAIRSYSSIGLDLGATERARGVERARFGLDDGGYVELVACTDSGLPAGRDVADFLGRGGRGLYETVVEVPGVAEVAGTRADVLVELPGDEPRWLVRLADPMAIGGARFVAVDTVDAPAALPASSWWRRIFTHAVAVASIDAAVDAFTRIGQPLWDRSGREEWGLDTAVFRQTSGSNVEFVCPVGTERGTASVVAEFMARAGGGHYMTVFEVADVDAVHATLVARGVRTLGPTTAAPPESPWGPVRQMWVHPKLTHGAFIEFLTVPANEAATR